MRKRARLANWTRDLSNQVLASARATVVRATVRDPGSAPCATDAELVAQAAHTTASVMLGHRRDLARLQGVEDRLLAAIERWFTAHTTPEGELLAVLDDLEQLSMIQRNVTQARAKRIELERRAWGLDQVRDDDPNALVRQLVDGLDDDVLDGFERVIRATDRH